MLESSFFVLMEWFFILWIKGPVTWTMKLLYSKLLKLIASSEVNNHYIKPGYKVIYWMISIFHGKNYSTTSRGDTCMSGWISSSTHPKYVFFRYENRPYEYVFLHAFFLICPPCPYQNLSIWPKTHPLTFRYENRPYKYLFLHAFFLICPPCPFQNLSIWPKHTLLFSGMKIDLINMHFCMRFS